MLIYAGTGESKQCTYTQTQTRNIIIWNSQTVVRHGLPCYDRKIFEFHKSKCHKETASGNS